jgi:AraC-like DNA-binding protein
LNALCGEAFRPLEIRFSHSEPHDIRPYQAVFQAPLTFDADRDAVIFDDKWLTFSLPGRDDKRFALLLDRLTRVESNLQIGLQEQLRSVLRPSIVSQSCTAEAVSEMLGLHPRTLNRRLQACGTTLREMLGEVRYELAQEMLADSHMSILGISNLLGYADASIFTRAFRRWSGMTPSAWREQHR